MSTKIFLILASLVASISAASVRDGSKIVGGIQVPIESLPYQVSVLYRGYHTCGGSIISPSFILTACHCTYQRPQSYFSVRAGSNSSTSGGDIFRVLRVFQHPKFSAYTLEYDFSLLQLTINIAINSITKDIVRLPAQNEAVPSGVAAIVSGWGATNSPFESPNLLRAVRITTIAYDTCNRIYFYDGGLGPSQICAGELAGGKDSCYGDSGGPLVDAQTKKLYGVVSWGIDCALPGWPGVYAKVSFVRTWIQSYVKTLQ